MDERTGRQETERMDVHIDRQTDTYGQTDHGETAPYYRLCLISGVDTILVSMTDLDFENFLADRHQFAMFCSLFTVFLGWQHCPF